MTYYILNLCLIEVESRQVALNSLGIKLALAFGCYLFVSSFYFFKIKKIWNGYYGWEYRDKTPFAYWSGLIASFVGGIFLIWFFGRQLF